jgi:hypothetical protein
VSLPVIHELAERVRRLEDEELIELLLEAAKGRGQPVGVEWFLPRTAAATAGSAALSKSPKIPDSSPARPEKEVAKSTHPPPKGVDRRKTPPLTAGQTDRHGQISSLLRKGPRGFNEICGAIGDRKGSPAVARMLRKMQAAGETTKVTVDGSPKWTWVGGAQ